MVTLNTRAGSAGLSPTMAGASAPCLHPDPVDLTVGEPEGLPPVAVREAAARAALEGRTRYGPAQGLPALRELLAADLTRRDGVPRTADNLLVTAGGKPAILDALRCVLEPGDEVLIFAPYWPTFKDQVAWAGGTPVIVPPGPDLLPAEGALDRALGPRTRAVILNQPSNPTGRVWDLPRLHDLADVILERDLWLVLDQVYGTLTLDGPELPFLRTCPDLADRTLLVESFSKRFAMTGYRLGAAAGPLGLIRAMTSLGSTSVTHPSMISQHAGIAALGLDGAFEREMAEGLRVRRDRLQEGLNAIRGIRCGRPEGAIYLFPHVAGWMEAHGVASDPELTARLRDEAGVKVLPGTAFGAPGYLRISIAASLEALDKALERMRTFFG
ncbi:aminotransferase class I/II-fold pyridoxal phosphate-dependent enzyme [Geothrix sp. 21YS21S-2]|uniref:aminotransferase class I/II-fold pyridoxal phosphate-dependent enzyme n=1 Tax=Geothrix sp. 21YS21S-2 TaxID=3068893 RepID=UPI0027BAD335|nr:aminotransferase class I/II-fold pyridoxal phosphate-dependent enzyme [Geothrix sp. 21YS21S-2]